MDGIPEGEGLSHGDAEQGSIGWRPETGDGGSQKSVVWGLSSVVFSLWIFVWRPGTPRPPGLDPFTIRRHRVG